ncbi:MAG: dihydropyrimidinase [Peptococcaceae bacterium]|nr:dihydropyrimidinase [Peptococcaceae bacterium]
MATLLCGGTVVTEQDYCPADVRIEGERIVAVGAGIGQPQDEVMDVTGHFLLPGGIDPHTHFDLSVGVTVTADDFASGTRAALLGGTTTIIDFATQFAGETLEDALLNWHAKADSKCYTDYGFHMAITDWRPSTGHEMSALAAQHGVVSFKLYMAYKHSLQVEDEVILQAMSAAKDCGALICLHCENGDIVDFLVRDSLKHANTAPKFHPVTRPVAAEREAVERAITLAEISEGPVYIVHLTSAPALAAIQAARQRGVEVYAETCPQYLLLDVTAYHTADFTGAKFVMSPPLRPREHQQALWAGLREGTIDTVATDHCSFNYKGQKELGLKDFSKIPNGIPGVETRLNLLYTFGVGNGKITLPQFVALSSTQPAKLFGLYPQKGTLAVGSDADIVVWDPHIVTTINADNLHHNCDYTPFEGFGVTGFARHVFLRGRQVVADGKLADASPRGRYLARKPFLQRKVGGYVYDRP